MSAKTAKAAAAVTDSKASKAVPAGGAGAGAAFVIPGQKLGDVKSYRTGAGTYELDGAIYASMVGIQQISSGAATTTAAAAAAAVSSIPVSSLPVIEVVRDHHHTHVIPAIGDVVTAKVTKINERVASVDILLVGTRLIKENFSGTIRKRDVRKFEVDAVEMYRMYRPGDIIRAEVISLGDSKSYFLSTAKNEYGVVLAQSTPAGHIMVPISWEQMQCPVTSVKEYRKVAKVDTATTAPTSASAAAAATAKP